MTAARLTPAAALNGSPTTSTRKGTRNTPPPMPSIAPSSPAMAPVTIVAAARTGVTSICLPNLSGRPSAVIAVQGRLDYAATFAMARGGVLLAISPDDGRGLCRPFRSRDPRRADRARRRPRLAARHDLHLGGAHRPHRAAPRPTSVLQAGRVIDAGGRTVIPGLIDAHVHVEPWTLPLFLKYGMTIGSRRPQRTGLHPAARRVRVAVPAPHHRCRRDDRRAGSFWKNAIVVSDDFVVRAAPSDGRWRRAPASSRSTRSCIRR